jgi:4-hydroxybenzoate polyprenyltransferase
MIFLAVYLEPPAGRSGTLETMPLAVALLLGAVVAVGLHICGVALNDVLDARHDRLFSPQRPIPAGRVRRTSAVVVAFVGLIAAVAGALFLGHEAILLCLLAGAGILFFNATGKHLPAAGILALALIRLINMLIPNAQLGFAWPLWMTMTHVAAATALGWRLEDKRPRLERREVIRLAIGWSLGTAMIVGYMLWRGTILAYGRPFIWIGPAIAGAIFFAVSWVVVARATRLRSAGDGRRRELGRAYMRLSILWLIVYDAAWLFCAGLIVPGLLHLMLFVSVYVILYLMGPIRQVIGETPRYRIDMTPAQAK